MGSELNFGSPTTKSDAPLGTILELKDVHPSKDTYPETNALITSETPTLLPFPLPNPHIPNPLMRWPPT